MKLLLLAGAFALAMLAVQSPADAAGRNQCYAVDIAGIHLDCDQSHDATARPERAEPPAPQPEPEPEPQDPCKRD